MNISRSAFARCAAIAILAAFAALLPQAASAQPASLAGTWNLVPDKSTAMPGPVRYKSGTLTFDSNQSSMTIEGVDADGKPVKATFAVTPDGKPHPVSGSPDFDASSWNRFSDTVTSYMYMKRKSNVVIGNRVLSREGNVLTFTEKQYDDKGKQTGTAAIVFAKPGFDFASASTNAAPKGQVTMTSPLTPEETAAAAALEKGDDDMAIAMFTKVIEGKPTPMLYYNHVSRGIAYAKKNQNELAIADFDAALKLKPDDTDARFRRGGTRIQMKQYQAAIDDLSAVVQADTTNATAFRLRGFSYNSLGQDMNAAADYEKACSLNKEYCN